MAITARGPPLRMANVVAYCLHLLPYQEAQSFSRNEKQQLERQTGLDINGTKRASVSNSRWGLRRKAEAKLANIINQHPHNAPVFFSIDHGFHILICRPNHGLAKQSCRACRSATRLHHPALNVPHLDHREPAF